MTAKEIKIIAVDMDGTLLTDDCRITDRTKKALERAYRAGIMVIPATGRSFRNTRSVLADFPFIEYYLTSNGSVFTKTGVWDELLFSEYLAGDTWKRINDLCRDSRGFYEIYSDFDTYVPVELMNNIFQCGLQQEYCDQLLSTVRSYTDSQEPERVNKLHLIYPDLNQKKAMLEELLQIEGIDVFAVMENNIEIVPSGINKGFGLKQLCHLLQIPVSCVMAIGDSRNDLEILETAGVSVAMGNAIEEVSRIADHITADNQHEGVALVIEQLLAKRI